MGFQYNLDAIERLSSAASSEATELGDAHNAKASAHVSAADFGTSSEASAIASAAADLDSYLQTELSDAETKLKAVASSLTSVHNVIEDAESAGTLQFRKGADNIVYGNNYNSYQYKGTGSPAGANPGSGTAPPVDPGHGVKINLPNGMGTVEAPNGKAAGAVRLALSQLGVPYVWGAATPGKGFDCSGLTSWAYGKEGISMPHYAQSQTLGEQVSQANLAPGDLVVWNGHVAMYIGKGEMIEAPQTGETVHITPLRTSNAGDAFLGFWRPSA